MTFRNKKVICKQATGSMTMKNRKFRTKNPNFRWSSKIQHFDDNARERGVRYIFPALPGARAGRPSPTICDSKSGSPTSNTITGVIGRSCGEHRFCIFGVIKLKLLEICEFVWQPVIFLKVFGVMAFDWSNQIAKRICNGGARLHQGPVP